ncbi:hypothetical protein [Facilibium subflavum]|uniref:hypothetical protein n=1 Tax=Facilibium subflavum TaxID=2219058 RepID=UPI0013C37365|nr:hypothetical protein [Facilibium subflavum]
MYKILTKIVINTGQLAKKAIMSYVTYNKLLLHFQLSQYDDIPDKRKADLIAKNPKE